VTFAELPGTVAVPGQCVRCGCTDDHACPGGCIWANAAMTLCSRCALTPESAPLCRACSECDGNHHFAEPMFDFQNDGDPVYVCKHCEARAHICEQCDGPIFPITGQVVCAECTADQGDFE
jgi:hypothetical protein